MMWVNLEKNNPCEMGRTISGMSMYLEFIGDLGGIILMTFN